MSAFVYNVNQGDAVSQLLQLGLKQVQLTDQFQFTGNGHQDVQALCCYAKNQSMANKELWKLVGDVINNPTIKAALNVDEALQAEVAGHILRAKAAIDLQNKRPKLEQINIPVQTA